MTNTSRAEQRVEAMRRMSQGYIQRTNNDINSTPQQSRPPQSTTNQVQNEQSVSIQQNNAMQMNAMQHNSNSMNSNMHQNNNRNNNNINRNNYNNNARPQHTQNQQFRNNDRPHYNSKTRFEKVTPQQAMEYRKNCGYDYIHNNNSESCHEKKPHNAEKKEGGLFNFDFLQGILGDGEKIDKDKIILIALIIILARQKADLKLLVALGYVLI